MRLRRVAVCVIGVAVLSGATRRSGEAAPPAPDWQLIGQEAARLLSDYIRIDTQNPPGRTVEAADFLEPLLRQAGLSTERIAGNPEKPILIGRRRGRAGLPKPIVLLNHMDVVPADGGRWSFAPLSGEIRDGVVHGRGALDMKGFGIVQLMALRLLAERGEDPRHDLVFLAVPDEEVGGIEGTGWLSENRPDLMDAAAVWDEGGLGLKDLFPTPVLLVSVTEKKVLWIRLVAEGPAGHGSRPFPEAATFRLQRALARVFDNLPAPRLTPITARYFTRLGTTLGGSRGFALRHVDNPLVWPFVRGMLQQDPLTNALVRDTVSITMLEAGYKPNVIPERAAAVLDCRLLPGTDQDVFLANLTRTIDDAAIRIEIIQPTEPAPASPTRHEVFKAIEASAREVYPDALLTPFMTVGGTDSRFFRRRRVPAYGFMPVLIPKELLQTTHGIDERIPVDSLGPAVRVVYETLRRL